jgi:hypothetical protein
VQLTRQPRPLLDDRELTAALEQPGVLDGDGRVGGERLNGGLVDIAELLRSDILC